MITQLKIELNENVTVEMTPGQSMVGATLRALGACGTYAHRELFMVQYDEADVKAWLMSNPTIRYHLDERLVGQQRSELRRAFKLVAG